MTFVTLGIVLAALVVLGAVFAVVCVRWEARLSRSADPDPVTEARRTLRHARRGLRKVGRSIPVPARRRT